jgi:hypothetical protein
MSYFNDVQGPEVLQQLKAMGTSNGGDFYHFFPVSETSSGRGEEEQADNGNTEWGTASLPTRGNSLGSYSLRATEGAPAGDFHFFPVSQSAIQDDDHEERTEGDVDRAQSSSASASQWTALQTALHGPRTSSDGADLDGQVDNDAGDDQSPVTDGGGGGYDDDNADDPEEAALLRASHITQEPHLLPTGFGGRGRWFPGIGGVYAHAAEGVSASSTAPLCGGLRGTRSMEHGS